MQDLTKGKEIKVILAFATPILIGNVFQQLYNVADTAIVGQFLGKEALSAIAAVFPLYFFIISFISGFSAASTILISQRTGAKRFGEIKPVSDTTMLTMFVSGLLIALFVPRYTGDIFRLMNVPPEVIGYAVDYFNVLLYGIFAIFGFNGIRSILQGLGDSKTPVYLLIASNFINITLDVVFILYMGMGIKGAAWATVIAYFVIVVVGLYILNRRLVKMGIHDGSVKFGFGYFKEIMRLGFPNSMQMSFVSVLFLVTYLIVNMFGTDVIAAYSAVGRINSLAITPPMILAMAMTTFTGQNYGAGQFDRIKRGLKQTWRFMAALSIALSGLIWIFSESLMKIFIRDAEVIRIGVDYLHVVSPFYIFFATMLLLTGMFKGIGDTVTPMIISFVSTWLIRIPVALFASCNVSLHPFAVEPVSYHGIWFGEPAGWLTSMIMALAVFLFSKKWQRMFKK